MVEPELPIHLTFDNKDASLQFVDGLEAAQEEVAWEMRRLEDGTVIVNILKITDLEERAEEENQDE